MIKSALILSIFLILFTTTIPYAISHRVDPPEKNIEEENCYCHGLKTEDIVETEIEGPDKIEVEDSKNYIVNLSFLNGKKWGFAADIDGKELDGAKLSCDVGTNEPENLTHIWHMEPQNSSELNLSLTAPTKPGKITLTVMINIINDDETQEGDTWFRITKKIDVKKKREIYLNATVFNRGDATVESIIVSFYVKIGDEWKFIENHTIESIEPGESANASIIWHASLVDDGVYTIRAVIDSPNKHIEFKEGNNVIEKRILITSKEEEKFPTWAIALIILTIVIIVVGIIYYLRKELII